MSQNCEQPPKKPYATPKLTAYGDVRTITEHTGVNGRIDTNPVKGAFRTQP